MTFETAYQAWGPDVHHIAAALGIKPEEADRLINEHMEKLHAEKLAARSRKAS